MKEGFRPVEQPAPSSRGIKPLFLVDPLSAYKLTGEIAETPVFVANLATRTTPCGVELRPLSFNNGQITQSPHYHENETGMGFFPLGHISDLIATGAEVLEDTGWLADVIPVSGSPYHFLNGYRIATAQKIFVKETFAVCQGHHGVNALAKLIDQGVLVSTDGRLVPMSRGYKREGCNKTLVYIGRIGTALLYSEI